MRGWGRRLKGEGREREEGGREGGREGGGGYSQAPFNKCYGLLVKSHVISLFYKFQ